MNLAGSFCLRLIADDPSRVARFQREAEVLASLNHPNIATMHCRPCGCRNHAVTLR
jgi:serine/threonine protein kinase